MTIVRMRLLTAALVLLALALGIALGAGPLNGGNDQLLPRLPNHAGSSPAVGSFEASLLDRMSSELVGGKLDGHAVLILVANGADADEVTRIRRALKDAGATVTGKRTLTAKLLDPANRQFAEGVARQAGGDAVRNGTDGYARVGAALARAVVGSPGAPLDDRAHTVWSALRQGGLLSGRAPDGYCDAVVVVVTGERSEANSKVVAGLAHGLDAAAKGSVVAGPSSSGLSGGGVAEVRSGDGGSTVDVTESAAGSLLVALALAEDLGGHRGAWGTARSADGALPGD